MPCPSSGGSRTRRATPGDSTYTRYQHIIDGDHDAYIRAFAQDAKRFGGRILLRFTWTLSGSSLAAYADIAAMPELSGRVP